MELSTAIHLLGDVLGEVISELESREIFTIEERIRITFEDGKELNIREAGAFRGTPSAENP